MLDAIGGSKDYEHISPALRWAYILDAERQKRQKLAPVAQGREERRKVVREMWAPKPSIT